MPATAQQQSPTSNGAESVKRKMRSALAVSVSSLAVSCAAVLRRVLFVLLFGALSGCLGRYIISLLSRCSFVTLVLADVGAGTSVLCCDAGSDSLLCRSGPQPCLPYVRGAPRLFFLTSTTPAKPPGNNLLFRSTGNNLLFRSTKTGICVSAAEFFFSKMIGLI